MAGTRKAIAAAVLALLAAGVILLYALLQTGFSARRAAGSWEQRMARSLRRAATPRAARELSNPMQATPEVLQAAAHHFADHCAVCHANNGSGDTPMGRGLFPPAPDMRRSATQSLTDGELYYIIQNGVRWTGMPAWGQPGPHDGETWDLVLFVRHLPQLTAAEENAMQQFNPRSPAEMKEEQDEEDFLNGHAPLKQQNH